MLILRQILLSAKKNQDITKSNIKNDLNWSVSPSIIGKRINEFEETRWMNRNPFKNEKKKNFD